MSLLLHFVCNHVVGHTWPSRPGTPPVHQGGAPGTDRWVLTEQPTLELARHMDREYDEVGLALCHDA